MDRFKEIFSLDNLKSKIGPLPVWAWGLILGLAVVFIYYVFIRGRGTSEETVGTPSGTLPGDPNAPTDQELSDQFDSIYDALAKPPDSAPAPPTTTGSGGSNSSGGGGGFFSVSSPYTQPSIQLPAASVVPNKPLQTQSSVGAISAYSPPAQRIPNTSVAEAQRSGYGRVIALAQETAKIPFFGPAWAGAQLVVGSAVYGNQQLASFLFQPTPASYFDRVPSASSTTQRRASGGIIGAPTTPGNPTQQTHVPVSPGQIVADFTASSGTPSAPAPSAPKPAAAKPAPKPAPKPVPKPVPISPGQKVAF